MSTTTIGRPGTRYTWGDVITLNESSAKIQANLHRTGALIATRLAERGITPQQAAKACGEKTADLVRRLSSGNLKVVTELIPLADLLGVAASELFAEAEA